MFGLENQESKRKSVEEFSFDLEKNLKDPAVMREVKKEVEEKISKIKQVLRSGENKEQFDQLGQLLHGYASLMKVFGRLKK